VALFQRENAEFSKKNPPYSWRALSCPGDAGQGDSVIRYSSLTDVPDVTIVRVEAGSALLMYSR